MKLAENTGDVILSVVVVIGFLMVAGLLLSALLFGGKNADTSASQSAMVSAINLLGNHQSRLLKISMDRGAFIAGFSSNSNVEIKRAKFFHFVHPVRIMKHPDSGVCSLNDACICIGSSRSFEPRSCLILNQSITNIYFKGDNFKINLGQSIDSEKSYLVLATTSLGSYHMLLNISRSGSSVFISILKIKKT